MEHDFAFPLEEFLARFPAFSNTEVYPTAFMQNCGMRAMLHITEDRPGMPMRGPYRFYALFLMTAHIATLDKQDDDDIAAGNDGATGGMPFKSTIGSVSIEKTKPNSFTTDDWSYWLNQTKYGRELLAYLDTRAPIGVYNATVEDSVRDLV